MLRRRALLLLAATVPWSYRPRSEKAINDVKRYTSPPARERVRDEAPALGG